MTDTAPYLDARRLTKFFRTPAGDFPAVRGIDLQVNRGEFVAVIGKSGSGKSTLINLITGIDRPTSGQVIIGGEPLHTYDEEQMAQWRGRNMGIVFQFFQLMPTLSAPLCICGERHSSELPRLVTDSRHGTSQSDAS